MLQTAWYWKKFYWKMFSTFVITAGSSVTVGLAGTDWQTMSRTQHIIFIVGVLVVTMKAQDALVDQTFNSLDTNKNGQKPNGNGNGVAAPSPTAPVVQQPTDQNK